MISLLESVLDQYKTETCEGAVEKRPWLLDCIPHQRNV